MRKAGFTTMAGLFLAGLTYAASVAAAPPAGAPERKQGNWEVKINMEMPGMPMKIPTQTVNQCVTQKDLVPDISKPGDDCIVKQQKVVGDTVSWKMQCNGKQGTMEGEGRIAYAADSYVGDMTMKMTPQAGSPPITMKMAMQGKWTGTCSEHSKKVKRADDY